MDISKTPSKELFKPNVLGHPAALFVLFFTAVLYSLFICMSQILIFSFTFVAIVLKYLKNSLRIQWTILQKS